MQVIEDGIQFTYNLGSGETVVTVYDDLLDNEFHDVTVTLIGKQAQLVLDNRLVANAIASGDSQVLDVDSSGMFVGGTLSLENVVVNGFDGCLLGLQLNGYSVPFSNIEHEIFSSVIPSNGVVHTCPELVETAPLAFQEEENSVLFHIVIILFLLFILLLSVALVVGSKLLNHYCISRRGKFVVGHNISVDIHRRRRSHSRSISLENVRPYHMEGGGESDNDEFSFHELRSLERPVTDLQETMHLHSPVRNGEVKRTPDHHHDASVSQLSDAYTMSAASALDVTPHDRNLPTVHEHQTASSAIALDTSTTHLLEDQQSPRIYEQPIQRRQQQEQPMTTIHTNENTKAQHAHATTATAAAVTTPPANNTENDDTKLNEVSNFITQKIAAANKEVENTNYDELNVYAEEGEFDPLGSLGSLYNMNMEDEDDETISLQSFSHLGDYGTKFQKINRILQRQDSSAGDNVSVAASSVVFSRERLQQEPYHDRDVRIV